MNKPTTRRFTLRRIAISVLCFVTLLLVALSLIPVKQPNGVVKQHEYSSVLKYLTFKVCQNRLTKQKEPNKPNIEKNLLTTIQEQANNATCFPIELVICNWTIHNDYHFDKFQDSHNNKRNKFYFTKKKRIESENRSGNTSGHYVSMRLFHTDRFLDLTFERYLPLSRIMRKANAATQNDVQLCLDYLPDATPRERALIFVSFYIYIEKLYKDGTQWGDAPNRLDKKTQLFVNQLISVMQKNLMSDEVAFNTNQSDLDEIARQWQVSFRRLFWNLQKTKPAESVFLADDPRPWIEVTLDSPDSFLYSLALLSVNSTICEAQKEYNIGSLLYLPHTPNELNEIFTSRTDTPLSYLNGYGDCHWNDVNSHSSPTFITDPRIENALFYPQRTEILTRYTDLLLPEENLNDEAREYLLSQFFFLRVGYMRSPQIGTPYESYNELANKADVTVGEVAKRLLNEINFIQRQ